MTPSYVVAEGMPEGRVGIYFSCQSEEEAQQIMETYNTGIFTTADGKQYQKLQDRYAFEWFILKEIGRTIVFAFFGILIP